MSYSLQENHMNVGVAGKHSPLNSTVLYHSFPVHSALLLYEFAITFQYEVEIVWRSRVTAVSLILLLVRWVSMVGCAIMTFIWGTPQVGLC